MVSLWFHYVGIVKPYCNHSDSLLFHRIQLLLTCYKLAEVALFQSNRFSWFFPTPGSYPVKHRLKSVDNSEFARLLAGSRRTIESLGEMQVL